MNLFYPLEQALNSYLSLDENYQEKLQPLVGKTLQVNMAPITMMIVFEATGVKLSDSIEGDVTTTLSGHPLAFIKLQFSDSSDFSLFKQDMRIEGDIEFGQQAKAFFDTIDIDWEEHLSRLTGDIVAHNLSQLVSKTRKKSQQVATSFQQNIDEYLKEEINLLPAKEAVDDFMDDVDALRLRVDRLEALVREQNK